MFEVAWFSRWSRELKDRLPWRTRVRQAPMDPVDEVLLRLRDYCESHSDPASLEDRVIRQVLVFATEQERASHATQQPATHQKAQPSKPSALVRAH